MNDVKLPPQSIESEEAVLGAVLCDDKMYDAIQEKVGLHYDDFYRRALADVWHAMMLLKGRSEPIDILTVANEIRRLNPGSSSPDIEYLDRLSKCAPKPGNAEHYARVVKEMSWWREVNDKTTKLSQEVFSAVNVHNAKQLLKRYLPELAYLIDRRLEPINSKGAHENT